MTECGPCGKFFTGTRAFDRHRVGRHEPLERRCLDEEEMLAIGMIKSKRGEWGRPVTDADRERFAALPG